MCLEFFLFESFKQNVRKINNMMDCRSDFYFNLENYLKDLSKNNVDNFISEISNLLYDENLEILKLDDLNDRFKPSELVALCEEHNVHLNCDYYLLSNDHLHFYELNRNCSS